MKYLWLLLFATPAMAQIPTQYAAMLTSADGGATWASPSGVVGGSPSYTPTVYAAALCQASAGAAWQLCSFGSGSGTISAIASSGSTISVTGGTGPSTNVDINLGHANTWTAQQINSTAGALSAPAALFSGTPITSGGTGTTTWPLVLVQPSGTTTTTWSGSGTMLGVNAPSGFGGNIFDFQSNGTSNLSMSNGGTLNGSTAKFKLYQSNQNCSSGASPAVCSGATSGSVAVAAGTNPTLQVNTSAVTANSQIFLTEDEGLSTKLGVTCNTATLPTSTVITSRSAGASFTFQVGGTFTTNPICYSYFIVN